jgi:hypothetical protein
LQFPPYRSQRSHQYEKESAPVHVPGVAAIVAPTAATPLVVGSDVFTGAGPPGAGVGAGAVVVGVVVVVGDGGVVVGAGAVVVGAVEVVVPPVGVLPLVVVGVGAGAGAGAPAVTPTAVVAGPLPAQGLPLCNA